MKKMEVLVEFHDYKKVVLIKDNKKILQVIQDELSVIDSNIELCDCTQFIDSKENLHRIQKWSSKFGCFVDITDAGKEVEDGDRILIVQQQSADRVVGKAVGIEGLVSKGVQLAGNVKSTPSAKVLSSLFPGHTSRMRPKKRSMKFDPTAECVVAHQQKKKKKALKLSKKAAKISCFLITDLKRGVPRGNYRADLKKNGSEAMIDVTKSMSSQQLKNAFLVAFNIRDFEILSCSDGKFHVQNSCQHLDAGDIIDNLGKSSMYIFEKSTDIQIESSNDENQETSKKLVTSHVAITSDEHDYCSTTNIGSTRTKSPVIGISSSVAGPSNVQDQSSLESPIYISSESDVEPGSSFCHLEQNAKDTNNVAAIRPLSIIASDENYIKSTFHDEGMRKRVEFCEKNLLNSIIWKHTVRRSDLYADVCQLFSDESIINSYPLRIGFEDELAVDLGGVCRDMFAGFWEDAYKNLFDGSNLLTPTIHPHTDTSKLPLIGRILSHGYLVCGYLPVRVALPTLIHMIKGPSSIIPDNMILSTFPDLLSTHEASVIQQSFLACNHPFDEQLVDNLVSILSRFGCRQLPTNSNFKNMILQVARYEFMIKPLSAVSYIHGGVPLVHSPFWATISVEDLYSLYLSLTANPNKIVKLLEAFPSNENEERIYSYLTQFVGNMNQDTVRKFLRFTTGSSVCLTKRITVNFNKLSGFARRPIGHTCDCSLELSCTYENYPSFTEEFNSILSHPEYAWTMDAI